jgi:hypothetical protein
MNKKYAQIFVSPEFKKKLKVESSLNDMSIVEWTRQLAREDDEKIPRLVEPKKRRTNLGF